MSKVFNMVGGGGGKSISSIIITGLESTDTVTCTKDGKSYAATWDEAAKHWEIVGLPLGTFTVTATNGTKTTTETVLIDIAGVYEIEMYFKLWLYKDGDECEAVTGGWNRVTSGYSHTGITYTQNGTYNTFSKQSDHMEIRSYSSYGVLVKPVNQIDFSKYSKLNIYVKAVNCSDSAPMVYITNETTLAGESTDNRFYFEPASQPKDEYGLVSVDLNIAENRHLLFEQYSGRNCDIQKVWLE